MKKGIKITRNIVRKIGMFNFMICVLAKGELWSYSSSDLVIFKCLMRKFA